jgi:hypothetical protein
MQILLRTVSGDTHWVDRLAGLLEEHPEVDPAAMGFPPGWRDFEVWR